MANVFLSGATRDVETAIMLEQAYIHDIGKAVAYTDGSKVFINTDENLEKLLPAYDHNMLKWLLWHERFHNELRHHNRFYKYLEELDPYSTEAEFNLTRDEVNIIMDILVHDSLSKLFPELVEQAQKNLSQMRNCNSLKYTFETYTLEEMLEEYRLYKKSMAEESKGEGEGEGKEGDKEEDEEEVEGRKGTPSDSKDKEGKTKEGKPDKDKTKEEAPSTAGGEAETEAEVNEGTPEPEHDKVDWSKLEEIDTEEFIDSYDSARIQREIERLKKLKLRLGNLTKTLNGLVTSTRKRTYTKPSYIHAGEGVILKGSEPGRTTLYLVFDASGSMSRELNTFKEIIGNSIPQAMETPTEWFSGYGNSSLPKSVYNPERRNYYKGKFKDIMDISAGGGYNDDELCWIAEQAGYTPIGVTDGGGQISWSMDKLKQLKKTILVGQNKRWLEKAKSINPNIVILDMEV